MRPSRPQEGMNDMVSRFAILADLIRGPEAAPRQAQQDRKAERRDREARRRRSREDIAFGRRAFLEQQARQAEESDPEAARLAHDKAMALLIVQAGARARGLPVPTRLIQDEPSFDREPSNEYPDDYHGPSKDPDDGDDSPVDDRDHKTRKTKKSKKAKDEDNTDEQAEDDEDAEDKPSKPRDRGDGDENTNDDEKRRGTANPMSGESVSAYWRRVDATAAAIIRAGKRRRGEIP